MENRIRAIRVSDHRLDPAQAEVRILVELERLTSDTEVRGRLMGPRCPYSTTVEVAYPVRELARTQGSGGNPVVVLRVVIPEPSFWEPESPFLYQGPVELWQDGQRCDQVQISRGMRTLALGPRGLRINGRLLTLHGVMRRECSEEDVQCLRQAGCNVLLVPVAADTVRSWDLADKFGFLTLGRLTYKADLPQAPRLSEHPSCLGWLLTAELLNQEAMPFSGLRLLQGRDKRLVGVELTQSPSEQLPEEISFLACPEELLPELAEVNLPKIILGKEPPGDDKEKTRGAVSGILGWIDRG